MTADTDRALGDAPAQRPVLHLAVEPSGWLHGIGPASLRAGFEGPAEVDLGAEDDLEQMLAPPWPRPSRTAGLAPAVVALLYWSGVVLHLAKLPVFMPGRQIAGDARRGRVGLVLPCLSGDARATRLAADWAMRCLFAGLSSEDRRTQTRAVQQALAGYAAPDRNTWPFLQAAQRLRIPAGVLDRRFVQYGWGSQQRVLISTLTDRTPAVAAVVARDKLMTAKLLRRAGLPVPDQVAVSSADEAAAAAARLGYPVVVKPAELDGGAGVAAGLGNESSLRRAFERARRLTTRILVERHVPGDDHRLMTFQGELIWAILRHPAAVTGDGHSTVQALLAALNADPRRGPQGNARLRAVDLDEEATELLDEQELTPDSVPEAGRRVRLRRTANINRGGIAVAVNERVHPDNRTLALQAAEALGLDIAGIDVLLPDIGRSWRETGGGICEVNGQPQLGGNLQQHLHQQMLQALVQGQGRIPLLLLVGADAALVDAVAQALEARGHRVGLARKDSAWLRDAAPEQLGRHDSLLAATAALLAHRRCDALLVCVEDTTLLTTGVAFDQASAVAWWGPIDDGDGLGRLLALLQPPGDTVQLVNRDCPACSALPLTRPAAKRLASQAPQAWVEALVRRCEDLRARAPGPTPTGAAGS